jgi:glycosyltransferase involved in cell wall biosynthesis
MKKLEILYLHQYFKFPYESGSTRSYDLSKGFIKYGHQVKVITTTNNELYKTSDRWIKLEKEGLIVYYMYLKYENHLSYFQRTIVFIKFLFFSTIKLLSIKGDVVLASSTPLTIGIPALIKKWVHKTIFIFEVRDVWPEAVIAIGAIKNKLLQKILFCLEFIIYKNAASIVTLSVDMKQSIISRYPGLTTKPIQVIENISEINRFQNNFNKEYSILKKIIGFKPRFTILYAGTFGRVNGINYVIKLAEEIIKIDATIVFLLVGDGYEKKSIIQDAQHKLLLNKNVFILDSISKHELPQLYYECSMGSSFVISIKDLWANSANKFFDTLAAGRPILLNYKGWQKNVIETNNIGYVLPEIITEYSLKNFILYTRNELLHIQQRKYALKIATESYSLNIALSKYQLVFQEIFR